MTTILYTLGISHPEFGVISPSEPVEVMASPLAALDIGQACKLDDAGVIVPDEYLTYVWLPRVYERRFLTTLPDGTGEAFNCWRRVR